MSTRTWVHFCTSTHGSTQLQQQSYNTCTRTHEKVLDYKSASHPPPPHKKRQQFNSTILQYEQILAFPTAHYDSPYLTNASEFEFHASLTSLSHHPLGMISSTLNQWVAHLIQKTCNTEKYKKIILVLNGHINLCHILQGSNPNICDQLKGRHIIGFVGIKINI